MLLKIMLFLIELTEVIKQMGHLVNAITMLSEALYGAYLLVNSRGEDLEPEYILIYSQNITSFS
jgi:hypothetical protein